MPVTVLNYSTPRDDNVKRQKRQNQSWWLRGAAYSFSGMAGMLVMIGYTLNKSHRGTHGLDESIALFLGGLAILVFAEQKVRRRQNSSAFARGAFIYGLLPGGLILVVLTLSIWSFLIKK
jgi:hypothetical protein